MLTNVQLESILDELLFSSSFKDYAPNGLQVEGKREIRRLAGAVTASLDVIKKAQEFNADALLVHHGYFWKGESPLIKGMKKKRLQLLLNQDINLYAYHLPLDCSISFGNNAKLGEVFDFCVKETVSVDGINNLLWFGTWPQSSEPNDLLLHIEKCLDRKPQHIIPPSNKAIKTIAWCSGAAQDYIENAAYLGADAFISGEISERTFYQANENDIHFFSCGHHATERFGIQSLCDYLVNEYQLEYQFFDSKNPV
jgi:dinuclear metal center YbgI/SA1388 family protein